MFIFKVCKALDDAKVPYAIVGGYAVALHGAVRGTVDVDFILDWTLENLQNAEKAIKSLGLVSRLPINAQNVFDFQNEYIQNKNLIAWNFYNPVSPMEQIDLIITHDLRNADTKLIRTPAGTIRILSLKDLIVMKKVSGRLQDLEDIKALESL